MVAKNAPTDPDCGGLLNASSAALPTVQFQISFNKIGRHETVPLIKSGCL
jgi:hypothetical protein